MATHADSTPAPAAHRSRLLGLKPELPPEPLLAPSPLPSLAAAFSRRQAIFGAVAIAATPAAILEAWAADCRPMMALDPADARLGELADAYEALERECSAHAETYRNKKTAASEDEFLTLCEGYGPIEVEIAETPAASLVGVLAKARACQVPSMRHPADEDVLLSIADDLVRLHAEGRLA